MSVFDTLVGQEEVRDIFLRAASQTNEHAMSQAWLITGPAGSGRSLAARMFAAALECTSQEKGCGTCHQCQTVMEGTHPDVTVMATSGTIITAAQTRELVTRASVSPGVGKWRIIIIEDADRMAERTTNVLLKAIEEPAPFTIWMLCTPSAHDVLPTIRSRCRIVRLRTPRPREVAHLLSRDADVSFEDALVAARAAQSHIGIARALIADAQVREQRTWVLSQALALARIGDVGRVAAQLLGGARERVTHTYDEVDASELSELLRTLGVESASSIPPSLRAQVKALQEEQKRRRTRVLRDDVDRAFLILLSLYRDVLFVQLAGGARDGSTSCDAHVEPGVEVNLDELVNADFLPRIRQMAEHTSAEQTIACMNAISLARIRLNANSEPLLLCEGLFSTLLLSR